MGDYYALNGYQPCETCDTDPDTCPCEKCGICGQPQADCTHIVCDTCNLEIGQYFYHNNRKYWFHGDCQC